MQQSFIQGPMHVEVSLSNQKHVFQSKYVRDAGRTEKVQLARQLLPKVIGTASFILLS